MQLITVVQARMTSSRFPGKTLQRIGDKTLLEWVLYRLGRSHVRWPVIVATSVEESDTPIVELCERIGTPYYRGMLDDPLDRYHTLLRRLHADAVVRVTADCPLLSPDLLDTNHDIFLRKKPDYVGADPLIADGLAQEIIGAAALEDAWQHATGPDREHVITYTLERPEQYRIGLVSLPLAESKTRFSVDTPADLERIRGWYERRPDLFDLDIPELIEVADG
jgi:spore coat polysaccharide biosynthesis protein SpsF